MKTFSKKTLEINRDKRGSNDTAVVGEKLKPRKRSLSSDNVPATSKRSKKDGKQKKEKSIAENKIKKLTNSRFKNIKTGSNMLNKVKKFGKSTDKNLPTGGNLSRKDVKKLYLEMKEKRKRAKLTDYETIMKAKKLWEELRHEGCSLEKRARLIASLYDMLEDKFTKVVFQHDTSRIVQWLLKLGTPTIRSSITKKLQPLVREMLQKKFSRFCVKNMLKYGDEECRRIVFSEIRGHVVKLMSSNVSAPIVEYGFSRWALPEEKCQFQREFYGNMLKLMGDKEVVCLKDALSSNIKNDVITDTKANILQVITKRIPASQVMHSIILEFLKCCDSGDRDEVIEVLYPHAIELAQTREGAEISMRCCWFTSGKMKKSVLKRIKGCLKNLCSIPHGYWFLMALLDSVDDIVILKKTVLHELLSNVKEILLQENGRKVITYLVAHRDTTYFHPELISLLKTADSSNFIKKDADIRRAEILGIVMEPLAKSISQDVIPWFHSPSTAVVLMAVLKHAKGEIWLDAMSSISSYICQDIKVTVNEKQVSLVEHSGFHFAIKKIIKNENKEESIAKLSYQLARQLTEEVIWKWLKCNRGCFLLTTIFESEDNVSVQTLLKKISNDMKKFVGKGTSPGAAALHKIFSKTSE